MMPQSKGAAPDFLQENYKAWGREYAQKRGQNPAANFRWKSYLGKPVNKRIVELLTQITEKHCSYCDGHPMGTFARETIDHFRPTSAYPRLAYVWCNLFLCCDVCQSAKRNLFDRKLLKPDAVDYHFEKYFMVNYRTGEIEINPMASTYDQERAKLTIEMFNLNGIGRPQSRLREMRLFGSSGYELDDFSYRFCLNSI